MNGKEEFKLPLEMCLCLFRILRCPQLARSSGDVSAIALNAG
jgi:hypothetical protein